MGKVLLLALVGYGIGSLPFGYWTGSLLGVDIRRSGSGNIGATNVFRVLGVVPGLLVLALDVGKGALSAHLGLTYGGASGAWGASLAGLAAIAGHNWSFLLGFRGGRGVATAAGVVFYLVPGAALLGLLVTATVILITRYASLGSLLGSAVGGLLVLATPGPFPYKVLAVLAVGFIYLRHLPNIRRLLAGQELRLGDRRRK
ncbi:MAG: glycerol-3-phosphate 1-O-acyltransferase PlsY [bacterium]|nr:glycerol-3-phosphate 1-O-acyltransferase PlsY [bacterium]